MFDAFPQPAIEWFAGGALIELNAKFAITKEFDLAYVLIKLTRRLIT